MADDSPPVSDFCVLNGRPDGRLSDLERLTVLGGAGLDRAIRAFSKSLAACSVDQVAPDISAELVERETARLTFFRAEPEFGSLFMHPATEVAPDVVHIHGFADGDVYDLSFPSVFPKYRAAHTEQYLSYDANQRSHVRYWAHREKLPGRATIIAIHGWTMGDQRVNSLAFLPGSFFSAGYDVALVELPFHGRRASTEQKAKSLFPSPDTIFTTMAMAHAVHDLRHLTRWLGRRGKTNNVCVGMSLGAYVGQLWATLDRLSAGVLLVPLVSMGDLAYQASRGSAPGVSRAALRNLFADHCCLERESATAPEKMLVIGGRGDLMVPREQISLLKAKWPKANFVWLSGGHAAHVRRGEAFRRIREFLSSIG